MTNREFYTAVANGTTTEDIKAFAISALAKLDNKNKKRRTTDTKEQTTNKMSVANTTNSSTGAQMVARMLMGLYFDS